MAKIKRTPAPPKDDKPEVKPAAAKKSAPPRQPPNRADKGDKVIGTALAIVNEKLGQGAAAKYNAARLVNTLRWQTEKMYVQQLVQRSEYLAQAICQSPGSLVTALQDAANLGLSISPQLGLIYLIGQRPKDGLPLEVYAKVSYKGMEQAVLASGTVTSINTDLVYENDRFESGVTIDGPFMNYQRARGERGALEGAFCQAKYANGDKHIEWMPLKDIEACKAAATKAMGKVPPVWAGDFAPEQQKKCCVRRAAKHWPNSPVIERLIHNFDATNPMEFGDGSVLEGESIVLIGDAQIEEMRKCLPLLNDNEFSFWTEMAAKSRKYESVRDIPMARFEEVRDALMHRMELVQKNKQPPVEDPSK